MNADRREQPMFSVLVATFNHSQFVEATLDSVARQSWTDYELVIVNDGSTDDTEAVVSGWIGRFRQTHPNRVILCSISNSGQSAATEHGFARCSGRYICLLDSDDLWLPHKLETVAATISEHPGAGMIVHPLWIVDQHGQRTGDLRPKRAKLSEGDVRAELMRTGRHVAPVTSGVVVRSDVFYRLIPMPTKHFRAATDAYVTLGASMLAPVTALLEPLAEYRIHPGGDFVRTMLSPEGLRRWNDLQLVVAGHFGLANVIHRNSWYARNAFAISKFDGTVEQQLRSYIRLLRATLLDHSFGPRDKLLLVGFWTLCMLTPRRGFVRLWRAFQLSHTSGIAPTDVSPPPPLAELPRAGVEAESG